MRNDVPDAGDGLRCLVRSWTEQVVSNSQSLPAPGSALSVERHEPGGRRYWSDLLKAVALPGIVAGSLGGVMFLVSSNIEGAASGATD